MEPITGIVLCGGQATRLSGEEKPLKPLLGRPLIERLCLRLRPQVAELVIVANRAQADYARYANRVVDDGAHRGRGPLAGIAAGLAAAHHAWVLCVPGDAPLIPENLAQALTEARQRERAEVAIVDDGAGRQPLFCLLPGKLLPDLRAYLDAGGSAPREWLSRHRLALADYRHWPRWAWSANTPEEWAAAQTELGKREGVA
ncbi:MAG: molybdenum cofactor guanylyltransferase MobA [Sinobacteraceae bacterium]|nr:molybdenum cofactor guanylyltransferase MobA [Nevskiaceae bacterium]